MRSIILAAIILAVPLYLLRNTNVLLDYGGPFYEKLYDLIQFVALYHGLSILFSFQVK